MEKDNEQKVRKDGGNWVTLDPKIKMSNLVLEFPELIEPLTYDYGLHCVNCMIADFDTLEEGAVIHGIEGEDFKEMIDNLEEIINNPEEQG
jgi:hybrid cluster-associated redox disulfide protein